MDSNRLKKILNEGDKDDKLKLKAEVLAKIGPTLPMINFEASMYLQAEPAKVMNIVLATICTLIEAGYIKLTHEDKV